MVLTIYCARGVHSASVLRLIDRRAPGRPVRLCCRMSMCAAGGNISSFAFPVRYLKRIGTRRTTHLPYSNQYWAIGAMGGEWNGNTASRHGLSGDTQDFGNISEISISKACSDI